MATLTTHDSSILKALFDPEGCLSGAIQINARLPPLSHYTESDFITIRAEETSIMRPLNEASVQFDTLAMVVDHLSTLIQKWPEYASAYINRAQTSRLLLSVDALFAEGFSKASSQLLEDLGRGIDLATPSSQAQISEHQTQVLAAGHTHRGFLLLKAAERVRKSDVIEGAGARLQSATADQIEELASSDFAAGGRYGNKMAQQMSVRTNPYAKMCGAMVKEAMKKEMEEAVASGLKISV